jgi:hypothetical protein
MHGRMKNAYKILFEKPERLADLGIGVSRIAFQNWQQQE